MPGRSFWHEAHLELPANLAPIIKVLIEPGRRRARTDGMLAGNVPVVDWLDQLDRLAAVSTPNVRAGEAQVLPAATPVAARWLTTAEAATVLGVSERRVRQIGDRLVGRTINGRRMWLETDVLEEAAARAECCVDASPTS
jgi:hypothetical protein